MTTQQGSLTQLLPEIYPIIASHLPLHATPSTLLALALTNQHISETVLPILYSRLILKNEADAISILQRLVDNPPFGRIVRELHILSNLSVNVRNQDPPADVISRLQDVIANGSLPFIHTLDLQLSWGWYRDPDSDVEPVKGFAQLRNGFWAQLKERCPRLRCLVLKGFTDFADDPWIEESGCLQVPNITNLTIDFPGSRLLESGSNILFRHISSLAHGLQTLDLTHNALGSPTLVFELDLPSLRSLSLASFINVDTAKTIAFFERHPSIEYVAFEVGYANNPGFASDLPKNFLPNLRHLRAHWNDVRLLAPILDRLLSLSIHRSVNAQIPYLLRAVLPNGLPNLRSLDIGQVASSSGKNISFEGTFWYESEDGTFQQAEKKMGFRTVFDCFMHSIVRAAPNLEELGFHGSLFQSTKVGLITGDLNGFPHLKHLNYEEYHSILLNQTELDTFASLAQNLAQAVPGLMSITNTFARYPPYLTARISREESGEVVGVEVGKGYGMKIGYEDQAFPKPWGIR